MKGDSFEKDFNLFEIIFENRCCLRNSLDFNLNFFQMIEMIEIIEMIKMIETFDISVDHFWFYIRISIIVVSLS